MLFRWINGSCSLFFKIQLHLTIVADAQFFKQQTRLNIFVVLVFAALILGHGPFQRVIENLSNLHTGVDSDWLDGEHFERPVTAKADVTEACGDMDE